MMKRLILAVAAAAAASFVAAPPAAATGKMTCSAPRAKWTSRTALEA